MKSPSQKVVITGEVVTSTELAEAKEPETPQLDVPQLAPIATSLGAVTSYEPLSTSGWFAPVVGGCGLLSLAIVGVGWWIPTLCTNSHEAFSKAFALLA